MKRRIAKVLGMVATVSHWRRCWLIAGHAGGGGGQGAHRRDLSLDRPGRVHGAASKDAITLAADIVNGKYDLDLPLARIFLFFFLGWGGFSGIAQPEGRQCRGDLRRPPGETGRGTGRGGADDHDGEGGGPHRSVLQPP